MATKNTRPAHAFFNANKCNRSGGMPCHCIFVGEGRRGDAVKNMISHSVRLEDIEKGFDIAGQAQDSVKVIVTSSDLLCEYGQ